MGSAFWADARIRYGTCPEWSNAELLSAWSAVAGACAVTQHRLFNHRLDVEADPAYVETYYIAVFAPAGDGSLLPFCGSVGPGEVAFQGGRYVDRLDRRDGEWRIASRQVCGDWFATARGSGSPRSRDDPDVVTGKTEHLDELLAVDAIRDCIFRYARGIDRLDRDLLASALVSMDDEHEAGPTQAHYITNLRVSLDGAQASAETYFISVTLGKQVELIGGRYVFKLTRTSGDWRIEKRTTVGEWHAAGDGQYLDAFLQATGNKSKRSREDGSYDPLVTNATSRTVEDLLEREGIRDCLARYARGIDRLDRELIGSSFVVVAPQFVDNMFAQADARPVQNHCWTNLRIELAGDVAHLEAYYMAIIGQGDDIDFVGGRYVIPLARGDNGQWAMTTRGNIGDWHARVNGSGLAAYHQATGNGSHPRGSRDDPSYIRIGWTKG